MAGAVWTDLLDPDREELERAAPRQLHPRALDLMLAPARHDDEPRPTLEAHIDYVFGVLLLPVLNKESHELHYQEIDLVLTHDSVMTVRKTPPGCPPFDPAEIRTWPRTRARA